MNFWHLQRLDSARPTGAFSRSFGLETLAQERRIRDAADLRAFCQSALFGVWTPFGAMLVKANYRCENAQIWRLDRELHAARAAIEARDGGRKSGKRLLQLARYRSRWNIARNGAPIFAASLDLALQTFAPSQTGAWRDYTHCGNFWFFGATSTADWIEAMWGNNRGPKRGLRGRQLAGRKRRKRRFRGFGVRPSRA